MKVSVGLILASIVMITSCGVKKELLESKATNQELIQKNLKLAEEVKGLKDQVSFLDEQLEIATGAQMINGVERNDIMDKSSIVLNAAEIMPQFPGEFNFAQYIEEKMSLEGSSVEPGTVYIEMVVLENGVLSEFKPIGEYSIGQNAQAIKMLKSTSPWSPGEINGNKVKVRMVMPIIFK